jgi:hypothetical protein
MATDPDVVTIVEHNLALASGTASVSEGPDWAATARLAVLEATAARLVGGILNAATGALTIKISIVNGWARAATVVTTVLRRSLKVTSSIPLAGLAPRRAEPE